MTNPIEKAAAHSQTLYLADKAPETQAILNALIDRATELREALDNLIAAANGITPTEEEFLYETAAIDPDCWGDWNKAVQAARDALNYS